MISNLPSATRPNPLESWLTLVNRQSRERSLRQSRIDQGISRLHDTVSQLASQGNIPQSYVATPPAKSVQGLDSRSAPKIKSKAKQLSRFLIGAINQYLGDSLSPEIYKAYIARAKVLLSIVREFNKQDTYLDLVDFVREKFPEQHDSQEMVAIAPEFMIREAIARLPNSVEDLKANSSANLLLCMADLHALIFEMHLDSTGIDKDAGSKERTALDLIYGRDNKKTKYNTVRALHDVIDEGLDRYKYWTRLLEQFYSSPEGQIPQALQDELNDNLYNEWSSFLVMATMLGSISLSSKDPENHPLKATLEERFTKLANLKNDLDLFSNPEADYEQIISLVKDFGNGAPGDQLEDFSRYLSRQSLGLGSTFEIFREQILDSQIRIMASTKIAADDGDISIIDNETYAAYASEQELLCQYLPIIYTLITKQPLSDLVATQAVDKFFSIKSSDELRLETIIDKFLNCREELLPIFTLAVKSNMPVILSKLLYDSLTHGDHEVKSCDRKRLLAFVERWDLVSSGADNN